MRFIAKDTYDVDTDDLTASLLDLVQLPKKNPQVKISISLRCQNAVKMSCLPQEISEMRLYNDSVISEDTHTVQFGDRFMFSGKVTAHELVSLERHLKVYASKSRIHQQPCPSIEKDTR